MAESTRRTIAWAAAPVFIILAATTSCGGGDATSPGSTQQTSTPGQAAVATVLVQAESPAALTPGASIYLEASPLDATGKVVTGVTVTWKSSDTTIAAITTIGVFVAQVTGIAPGSVTVSASTVGATGTALVVVNKPTVPLTVIVQPDSISFVATAQGFGAPVQLGAALADSNGNALTGIVTWSSSNSAAASVSATGLVTPNPAVNASSFATITATSSGTRGTATIVVNPQVGGVTVTPATTSIAAGQTAILKATVRDTHGNVLTGVTVLWTNFNANIVKLVRYGDSVSVIGLIPGFANVVAGELTSGLNATAGITVTAGLSAARTPAIPVLPPRVAGDRAKFR